VSRVVIVKCEKYSDIRKSVEKGMKLFGDLEINCGERVLLKPNLLMAADPSKHITTHPLIIKSVGKKLKKYGAKLVIGDSPAGIFTKNRLKKIYELTGMDAIAKELGVELNYDTSYRKVEINGRVLRTLEIANFVLSANRIITLPKMKTHTLTTFTGAIKILYGCVPGLRKAYYHGRFPRAGEFSKVLLDVYDAIKTDFVVMDAIYAMEGSGPSAGTPRKVGLLLFSDDGIAMDVVSCEILGIPVERVPYLAILKSENRIPKIEIEGEDIEEVKVKDFKYPRVVNTGRMANSFILSVLTTIEKKPYPDHSICTGCGECYLVCPQRAIRIVNGKAIIDYTKCIKCFCCQESCPYHAIKLRRIFRNRSHRV